MKKSGIRRAAIYALICAAGLCFVLYWNSERADSEDARQALRARFGAKSESLTEAYFYRPWNFVGRSPEYLRFRYEDEADLMLLLDVKRSSFKPFEKLPAFGDKPGWWKAERPQCVGVDDGGTVPLNGAGFCLEPGSRVAYAYYPGH